MIGVLKAEIYKILRQSKTLYALAAIFIIEGFVLLSAYYQGTEIIDLLLANLKDSFEFKGDLLNGNLIIYMILNSLWFHIPLILMIVVSGFLTSEYKDRTVEAVLLQPVNKITFIGSKYIVSIIFTVLVVILLAITTFLISYMIFGKGDLVVYLDGLNFYPSNEAFWRLCCAFMVGTVSMLFFSVVSLTFAVFFKDATKTWIVSAIFLVCTNLLLKIDFNNSFWNSFFYSKLIDSWQYYFYYEIPYQTIYLNIAVLIFYCLIISGIGIIVFNRRDL
ncbi:MAG: ABC transporter permease [Eudoraea sp.]|uniref:ABC transporter permease n=1 Tax=Eudoraea sp. TaxID=1979955 RepID=UPI003C7714F3